MTKKTTVLSNIRITAFSFCCFLSFVISLVFSTNAFSQAITHIAVNDDENLLLVAHGKIANLWDINKQKLLYDLKIPVDQSFENEYAGNIYVADFLGNHILLAGFSDKIYFFDVNSAKPVNKIDVVHNNNIMDICISNDKNHLAAIGREGLEIWEKKDNEWEFAFSDTDYHKATFECEFFKNHKIITTSNDGFIRLYDINFSRIGRSRDNILIGKMKMSRDDIPFLLSMHAEKPMFIVNHGNGKDRIDKLTITHIKNDQLIFSENIISQIMNDNDFIRSVFWHSNENLVYFNGNSDEGLHSLLERDGETGKVKSIFSSPYFISKILKLKNGNIIIATSESAWLLLDKEGTVMQHTVVE